MPQQIYVVFRGHNLPDHAWLKARAKREGRSMAQEILALIRQAQVDEAARSHPGINERVVMAKRIEHPES